MRAVLIAAGMLAATVAGCEAGRETEVKRMVEEAESLLAEGGSLFLGSSTWRQPVRGSLKMSVRAPVVVLMLAVLAPAWQRRRFRRRIATGPARVPQRSKRMLPPYGRCFPPPHRGGVAPGVMVDQGVVEVPMNEERTGAWRDGEFMPGVRFKPVGDSAQWVAQAIRLDSLFVYSVIVPPGPACVEGWTPPFGHVYRYKGRDIRFLVAPPRGS